MAKERIYEIARRLGRTSQEVLQRAQELGLEVKTASSGLTEEDAQIVALSFQETAAPTAGAATTAAAKGAEAAPQAGEEAAETPSAPAHTQAAPPEPEEPEAPAPAGSGEAAPISIPAGVTVEGFAEAIGVPTGEVVKALLLMGEPAAAQAPMPEEAIDLVAEQFGVTVTVEASASERTAPAEPTFDDRAEDLRPRPPVVTVMGHVDHGKTRLLDQIRKTNVIASEAGGITQHIGAYQVTWNGRKITFIDTPGHEAFTAMRARGANVTDIVILVVAADDGVMPQTVEAISHAKAADVEIIVAINKIDLPGADPARVRTQLTEYGLIPEEFGGDTVTVEVSAATGQGIDQLLEMIDLIAQVNEYKANPNAPASGVIVESQLDKGRGPVATVIVQRGTLKRGDPIVSGAVSGRVRAMLDENNRQLKEVPPGTPALVMGWSAVPTAGDPFEVVGSDQEARARAEAVEAELRKEKAVIPSALERLEQLLESLRTMDEAELRLIVKADTHGSLEAVKESIGKIGREGGRITIVHAAVGGISENDVSLAEVTESIIVGFNVRPDGKARKAAEQKGIEIRTYRVIYEMLDEIEQMLVGRLAPEEVERVLGTAEVRAVFKVPRIGAVAGCFVTEGEIVRGAKARLLRQGVVVYDGKISSLRRFKEDVRTVASGFECGIGLENFNDIKEGDVIEAYQVAEVARQ